MRPSAQSSSTAPPAASAARHGVGTPSDRPAIAARGIAGHHRAVPAAIRTCAQGPGGVGAGSVSPAPLALGHPARQRAQRQPLRLLQGEVSPCRRPGRDGSQPHWSTPGPAQSQPEACGQRQRGRRQGERGEHLEGALVVHRAALEGPGQRTDADRAPDGWVRLVAVDLGVAALPEPSVQRTPQYRTSSPSLTCRTTPAAGRDRPTRSAGTGRQPRPPRPRARWRRGRRPPTPRGPCSPRTPDLQQRVEAV